jgi:regulator of protease activity HflC (stomatin/prohibitin superfamily)
MADEQRWKLAAFDHSELLRHFARQLRAIIAGQNLNTALDISREQAAPKKRGRPTAAIKQRQAEKQARWEKAERTMVFLRALLDGGSDSVARGKARELRGYPKRSQVEVNQMIEEALPDVLNVLSVMGFDPDDVARLKGSASLSKKIQT